VVNHVGRAIRRFIPEPLKPPLRSMRRVLQKAFRRIGVPLGSRIRSRAYRSPSSWWLVALPAPLRRSWRLDPPAKGLRRIDIGSGPKPHPGYIHVDVDPHAPGVDFLARMSLPFGDGWADELLSVHSIEHISPLLLKATLREWFRVLRNGGEVRIHTPNGESIGRALLDSASGTPTPFWAVQSAIFGYFRHPRECMVPEDLRTEGDHTFVFTFPVLRELLREAGFSQVENISGREPCYHFVEWEPYVPGLCLEIRAVKLEAASMPPSSITSQTAS
jgi:SAM-dependent methyltransferase